MRHIDRLLPRTAANLFRCAFAVTVLVLAGCGSSTVDVVLPSDAKTHPDSKSTCRNVIAGSVTSVTATQPVTATVRLDSSDISEIVLREGVQAYVLDSGDIEFDVKAVSEGAKPLPSGSKLVATRRNAVQAAIDRWATGWNIAVVIVGLIAMLVVFVIGRAVAGMARIVVALLLAGAIAYLAAPPLAPMVEQYAYPLLESARGKPVQAPAGSSQTPPQQPTAAPAVEKARGDLDRLAESASETLGSCGRQVTDTLRNRPLPNPVYPAFFGVWLVGFVLFASTLRRATSTR